MRAVGYYRVSTSKQGRSGLGLEAQQAMVQEFCQREGLELVNEYTEVESGKGFDALMLRPKLNQAFETARKIEAVVVVAKLDRLSRDVAFVTSLMASRKARFVVAELGMDADETMLGIYAVLAQRERKALSDRTSAALQALKARGAELGNRTNPEGAREKAWTVASDKADEFASRVGGVVKPMLDSGLSHREIAKRLNEIGVPTARGGKWQATTVSRVVARLN